jgi:signal transduction histidine kinase
MTKSLLVFCCLLILLSRLPASAAETVLTPTTNAAPLTGQFEVLRDAGAGLPLDRPPEAARFEPLKDNLAAGYTRDAYWLRFTLRRTADAPREWLLEAMPAFLDHVDLYIPVADGYAVRNSGDRLPIGARDLDHRNFVFRLDLSDDVQRTYYLRVQSSSTLTLRAILWQPAAFVAASNREYWLFGNFFGALGIMLLVNLLLYYWLRGPGYAWYCAYLFFDGIGFLSSNGFTYQYLFPFYPLPADYLVGISLCATIFSVAWMFVTLLDLPQYYPRLAKIFKAVGIFGLIGIPVVLMGKYSYIAGTLFQLSFALGLASIGVAFRLALQGNRPARWIFYAFIAQFFGLLVTVLRNLGFLPSSDLVDHALPATTVAHLVLINIGVAVRFKEAMDTRQQAQEIALQAAVEIERAQAQRSFVAMISHEFRNPLATIEVCLDSLYRLADGGPQEVLLRYSKIKRAKQRIRHLLDNYLTSERIKEGRLSLSSRAMDLSELLAEIVLPVQEQLKKHNLNVQTATTPLALRADPELLNIAIHNLLDNAIKYSPEGGEIRVEAGCVPGAVYCSVADRGNGIPQHELPFLFDLHYRGAVNVQGAGLGLHLVKQIVELHGGTVTVESTLGVGSTFTLRLPEGA